MMMMRSRFNPVVVGTASKRVFATSTRSTSAKMRKQQVRKSTFCRRVEAFEQAAAPPPPLWEFENNVFSRVGKWYSEKLSTHPLLTKGLTGGAIAAGGDMLCQGGTRRDTDSSLVTFFRDQWDYMQTFRFWLIGTAFVAPCCHYWYAFLHKYYKGQSFAMISKRVALDQAVLTPPFLVVWLSSLWTLEGTPPKEIPSKLVKSMPEVLAASLMLWTPAQYLNFYACPVKFQVLFTNVFELLWNAYLSFATTGGGHGSGHQSHKEPEEEKVAEEVEEDNEMDYSIGR